MLCRMKIPFEIRCFCISFGQDKCMANHYVLIHRSNYHKSLIFIPQLQNRIIKGIQVKTGQNGFFLWFQIWFFIL